MLSQDQIKELVANEAAQLVEPDMILGIGSGSTVHHLIIALGQKVKEGLTLTAVPTSAQTLALAIQQGIHMVTLNEVSSIDLTIDGADETDHQLQLIKGGGGALLQEKMVAAASNELVIMADDSKLKDHLGKFPLPIEVIPYGWMQVKRKIEKQYAIKTSLRKSEGTPFITDHGHYILDCHFQKIDNSNLLNNALHQIPGVVETGLFVDMCDEVIIGYPDGSIQHLSRQPISPAE